MSWVYREVVGLRDGALDLKDTLVDGNYEQAEQIADVLIGQLESMLEDLDNEGEVPTEDSDDGVD